MLHARPSRRDALHLGLGLGLGALAAPGIAVAQEPWPRRIPHRLGTAEIPHPPRRVVSAGYHEQDFLYALGIAPVGVHEWFGGRPFATWSWAEPARRALNAAPAVQRGYEIDLEWVRALKPDLIAASFFGLDPALHAQLSTIAPTIATPPGFGTWSAPWQAELRLLGAATGREAAAEAHVRAVEAQAAAARRPAFEGRSGTTGYFVEDRFIAYPPQDGANRLLGRLGIETPPAFATMGGGGQFAISPERMDMLDLDTVVWLVDPAVRAQIEGHPLWPYLRLAREDRSVWADEELTGALAWQTPLSIPYALSRLVPMLEAALAGKG